MNPLMPRRLTRIEIRCSTQSRLVGLWMIFPFLLGRFMSFLEDPDMEQVPCGCHYKSLLDSFLYQAIASENATEKNCLFWDPV